MLKVLGALSNDEVNNNVRKTIGFMSKATALHEHHTYEYSLKFTARLRRETSECDVLWRTWTHCDSFSLLYLNMDKALIRIQFQEKSPTFDELDAIKRERLQIHFFSDAFTAVVVVVA